MCDHLRASSLPKTLQTTTCAVAIDGKEIYSWGGLNNLPLPPNVVTVLKAMMGARYDWLKSMAVDPDHK